MHYIQIYVKLMHCACRSCEIGKRCCRSLVNRKHHPNEKLKSTCIMVFSALADFIDCCKGYYSKQPHEEESYENQPQNTTQEYNKHQRSIIENQEINHKNQGNNEDNHERTKERQDCENHNKPASEPRNHNKHNNGCLSVLWKRVLVCPCFLVWVFFLFCIFCIAIVVIAPACNTLKKLLQQPKQENQRSIKTRLNLILKMDWTEELLDPCCSMYFKRQIYCSSIIILMER